MIVWVSNNQPLGQRLCRCIIRGYSQTNSQINLWSASGIQCMTLCTKQTMQNAHAMNKLTLVCHFNNYEHFALSVLYRVSSIAAWRRSYRTKTLHKVKKLCALKDWSDYSFGDWGGVRVAPPNCTVVPPSLAAIYNRGTVLSSPPICSRSSHAHRLLSSQIMQVIMKRCKRFNFHESVPYSAKF